jgi:putative PIN family toxin of toxin-antitoxin system
VRIVIDTNIWVSGLLWKGDPWRLLLLAEVGEVEICIAYPMLLELEEVLSYERFQSRLQTLDVTAAQLAVYSLTLATAIDVSRQGPPIVTADPDDDIFLHCAVEAQAAYVVTNDRHLLAIRSYRGVGILKVEDFFAKEFGGQQHG